MAVIFAGGEFEAFEPLGDVVGTTGEFEFDTATTAAYDGDYARGSMRIRRASVMQTSFAAATEGWLHFSFYHNDIDNANMDNWVCRLGDKTTLDGGRAAMILGGDGGNFIMKYWNGSAYIDVATMTAGAGQDVEDDTLYTFDIHWKIDDATGIFELFLDGVSQGSFEGDTNVTGVATIDGLELACGMRTTDGIWAYFSEVIIADESTIGWKLATLGASANGTNNDFTNGEPEIDDIGEPSDLTLIRSGLANDIQEFIVDDISAGASADGLDIAAIVVVAKAMVGSSVVTNIQASVATGGSPFVTGNLTVNSNCLKPVIGVFDVNPDTSSEWTESEVNAAEFGIKSIA